MYTLVVVDDEYEIRTGLSNCFPWREVGFNVVKQFENGRECLNYICKNKVDTVLCDVKMPIMSGIELAKEIFEKNIDTKMVIISGYTDFEYARQALRYGVKDYIVKPTKYNEIVEVFKRIKSELDSENISERNIVDNEKSKEFNSIISIIKNYVEENYNNVTLEDVAKIVYMNPYYLSKYFKQKTGMNFSDYITYVRMKKAVEFLKNPLYKTYEVGYMIGYKNPKNFSRAFKKYFKKSPKEYINSAINFEE
ncbi:MAG: two-component system, response regulator YesN [Thermoanaerobacterium sp.]|nr:two-component system, response regulator YesN [Thermoanaerobacterium sp.]MDI3529649.1 two-component system, response regulator YesN [Thermoanaerobacter sp.]